MDDTYCEDCGCRLDHFDKKYNLVFDDGETLTLCYECNIVNDMANTFDGIEEDYYYED